MEKGEGRREKGEKKGVYPTHAVRAGQARGGEGMDIPKGPGREGAVISKIDRTRTQKQE